MTDPVLPICTAQTTQSDPYLAVADIAAQLNKGELSLVLFFCSTHYEQDALAEALNKTFEQTLVVGCTSAGEIGPLGYTTQSISAVSFPKDLFSSVSGLIHPIGDYQLSQGETFVQGLMRALENQSTQSQVSQSFALLLIDGLSQQEEPVVRSLNSALGTIPLIGGSAGDDLAFEQTAIFHNGAFHTNSAVLILASTPCRFMPFKTQHFKATSQRLVVTLAEAESRRVIEINGLPAAEEYAYLVGVDRNDLNPMRFAASPVVVLIDGQEYVRSIQKANPDGSLTFYCAIDEGIVLRVAQGIDLTRNLQQALDDAAAQIGKPWVTLANDCILRKLEINQNNLEQEVGHLLKSARVVGFNTYGEQFGGVHVNQTFTALAIGAPEVSDDN